MLDLSHKLTDKLYLGVQPPADNSVHDVRAEGVTLGSDLANTVLGCAILVFDEP